MHTRKLKAIRRYTDWVNPKKPVKIRTHQNIIKDQQSLGQIALVLGIKRLRVNRLHIDLGDGIIALWRNAVVIGDEARYMKRLRFIEDLFQTIAIYSLSKQHRYFDWSDIINEKYEFYFELELTKLLESAKNKIKNNIPFDQLKEDEQNIIETEIFLTDLVLANEPRANRLALKTTADMTSTLYHSKQLEADGGIHTLYHYCYTETDFNSDHQLSAYLNDLNQIIGCRANPSRIAITVKSIHDLAGIRYIAKDKWLLVYPDSLPGKEMSTKSLSKFLKYNMHNEEFELGLEPLSLEIEINSSVAFMNTADSLLLVVSLAEFHHKNKITPEKLNINQAYITLMILAARSNNSDIINAIPFLDRIINRSSKNNVIALNMAADSNHVEMVKLLIRKLADPTLIDYTKRTPLMSAVINSNVEMIGQLILAGAPINQINEVGESAQYLAAEFGDLLIFKALEWHGADLAQVTTAGRHAIHNAAIFNNVEILNRIIEKGVDVNLLDNEGLTPAILAALAGSYEALKVLVQYHCNLAHTSSAGTVRSIAVENRDERIIRLLDNSYSVGAQGMFSQASDSVSGAERVIQEFKSSMRSVQK